MICLLYVLQVTFQTLIYWVVWSLGVKFRGAKLIVVLGHASCGAIKSAIDDVKLGNITTMLEKIKPAVKEAQDFKGQKTSKNPAFVEYVGKHNVLNTIKRY